MKQYIGLSRDHSGSMRLLAKAAARDYNQNIAAIKKAATQNNIDTIVSTVKCGVGSLGRVERESINSSVSVLEPIAENSYTTDGGATPLFDSVGELIQIMKNTPDANERGVSFLVMVITDGHENSSKKYNGRQLGSYIQELQATDKWTFVFRVPRGYARTLASLGIHEGNILEWDQTETGLAQASAATEEAISTFYSGRTRGITSTKSFYTNLVNLDPKELKKTAIDITTQVKFFTVGTYENDYPISKFVGSRVLNPIKGCAFYQLSKPESQVQDYKKICIRHKKTERVYGGQSARSLLGLPSFGTVKVVPGDHGDYDIFIQSTSVNRKVKSNTQILYWAGAV